MFTKVCTLLCRGSQKQRGANKQNGKQNCGNQNGHP